MSAVCFVLGVMLGFFSAASIASAAKHRPAGETAVFGAIAIACAAVLAVLL